MKDTAVVKNMEDNRDTKQAEKEQLKGQKSKEEKDLQEMFEEQSRLNGAVEARNAIDARMNELYENVIEEEATSTLRRAQGKLQDNTRYSNALKNLREDVSKADKKFKQSLQIQAQAARSNAVATGANLGQAIGGRGGRGFGNSPGERLMQIRRNQATKKSILLAKDAADILNTAQNRVPPELRTSYPTEMEGIGNLAVPDLWHGSFFRDFLVGQVGGNIGDAVNQVRAMKKIRRNMQELEVIIAACDEQLKKIRAAETKVDRVVGGLETEVNKEETEIFARVKAAAK